MTKVCTRQSSYPSKERLCTKKQPASVRFLLEKQLSSGASNFLYEDDGFAHQVDDGINIFILLLCLMFSFMFKAMINSPGHVDLPHEVAIPLGVADRDGAPVDNCAKCV